MEGCFWELSLYVLWSNRNRQNQHDYGSRFYGIGVDMNKPYPPGYDPTKYLINYYCTNCQHEMMVQIENGEPAPHELRDVSCSNCGCYTLRKNVWIKT